jgi:hypothetical protein
VGFFRRHPDRDTCLCYRVAGITDLVASTLSRSLSGNADGFQASEIVHSVPNMVGDRDFGSSSLRGMRSKSVADDTLVAADLTSTKARRLYRLAACQPRRPLAVMFRICP